MTIEGFVKLVCEMRELQKEFFATRSRTTLAKARKIETRVDRVLLEMRGRYVAQMEPLPGFMERSEPSSE